MRLLLTKDILRNKTFKSASIVRFAEGYVSIIAASFGIPKFLVLRRLSNNRRRDTIVRPEYTATIRRWIKQTAKLSKGQTVSTTDCMIDSVERVSGFFTSLALAVDLNLNLGIHKRRTVISLWDRIMGQ